MGHFSPRELERRSSRRDAIRRSRNRSKPKNLYGVIHCPSSFLYYAARDSYARSPIRKSSEHATIRPGPSPPFRGSSDRPTLVPHPTADPIEISGESLNHPRPLVSIGIFFFGVPRTPRSVRAAGCLQPLGPCSQRCSTARGRSNFERLSLDRGFIREFSPVDLQTPGQVFRSPIKR